jgi:hypothetical protein
MYSVKTWAVVLILAANSKKLLPKAFLAAALANFATPVWLDHSMDMPTIAFVSSNISQYMSKA